MKIKAKDITAQPDQDKNNLINMPQEDMQHKKILEEYKGDPFQSESSKLERDFFSGGLGYGDRMRIGHQDSGNMYDVILYPDGMVGIQDLKLTVEFGKTEKYATWGEALDALPKKYDVIRYLGASTKGFVASLIKKISDFVKNPYNK